MKLILFAQANQPRKAFQQLLGDSGHCLECYSLDEVQTCDLKTCDMVLLDGNARGCAAQHRLLEAAQDLRSKAPRVPIMILSAFDSAASRKAAWQGCGVTASGDGSWHLHCRLKELAWRESEALLHETLEREPLEPITFEYRG
jgi:DNA-binding NarL/FixJ family response regulator